MRRLRQFFNSLFLRHFRGGPQNIPKRLPPEALRLALEEARFLYGLHGVEVHSLAPGEKEQVPKAADGSEPPSAL